MNVENLEKRLADLQEKKQQIAAREQRIKLRISAENRKKENHCKMVLGGAVYGYVKSDLPEDRKDLELYGYALKAAIEAAGAHFIEAVNANYAKLKAKQAESSGNETV